jgi:vacuolar-type H+-ATPase subunit I/STV1
LYAQLLIAVSFVIAAYQDVKERAVNDLVWLPALAGVVYIFYTLLNPVSPLLGFQLIKIVLLGGISLGFAYFGLIGQADAIAMALIAADPYFLSPIPPLLAAAVVALSHIGYEFAVGNARGGRTIPIDKFLREQRWIPKAIVSNGVRSEVSGDVNVAREEVEAKQTPGAQVEVSYGVPTVAYLGIGYAAFIVYLIIFGGAVFSLLP